MEHDFYITDTSLGAGGLQAESCGPVTTSKRQQGDSEIRSITRMRQLGCSKPVGPVSTTVLAASACEFDMKDGLVKYARWQDGRRSASR